MPPIAILPAAPVETRAARRSAKGIAAALAGVWLLVAPCWAQAGTAPGASEAQSSAAQDASAPGKVITAHGISTFGPLKYPADFKHLDYVNPDAPKGGAISEWAFGGFDNLNPYSVTGRADAFLPSLYESLLTGTADEAGAAYCLLCKTLEYPPDRAWVIFDLRPDIRFSDGSPLTAADVAFSYHEFAAHGLPSLRRLLDEQVASVEVLGPLKIRYTFKPGIPTRDLPQSVGGLPVFSKADFKAHGYRLDKSSATAFLGSGPYVVDKVDMGQSISYRRNPDYWGRDLPINLGRNNFDHIRFVYYADYNAAFEGFKGGTYTFRQEALSKLWATSYDFPAVKDGSVKVATLPDGNLATGQSFVFNLDRPQFRDPRVREAIGLMFNFNWSNHTLFYGLYGRVTSFWQNSDLAASGKPTAAELALLKPLAADLPDGVLTEDAVVPPESGARQLDRRNMRKAAQLLDEAGWKVGADGKRHDANGRPLRVEFLNDSPSFDRIILPFVSNLQRLGIDAYATRVDNAQLTDRKRNRDFDVLTAQFPMSLRPGGGLKQYFGSQSSGGSLFNVMGLKNKAVDALIGDVLAADSLDQLTTAVHALDRVLRAQRFWVPQWYNPHHWVAYYDMYDHPATLPPYSLGELDFWWYDAKKAAALKAAGTMPRG